MARFASVLIPSDDTPLNFPLAATTASSLQTLGKNRIFVINADQDMTILFGNAAGPTITPSASNGYRIPANQQVTLDTGNAFDSFAVFNLGTQNGTGGQTGTTATHVYVLVLSVV